MPSMNVVHNALYYTVHMYIKNGKQCASTSALSKQIVGFLWLFFYFVIKTLNSVLIFLFYLLTYFIYLYIYIRHQGEVTHQKDAHVRSWVVNL